MASPSVRTVLHFCQAALNLPVERTKIDQSLPPLRTGSLLAEIECRNLFYVEFRNYGQHVGNEPDENIVAAFGPVNQNFSYRLLSESEPTLAPPNSAHPVDVPQAHYDLR